MISVSSNDYFAVVRAAQTEAIRSGLPMNGKQSVAVTVDQTEPPPAPPETNATATGRVVDVMV